MSLRASPAPFAKPSRDLLEGCKQCAFLDLDFADAGLECQPPDAFRLARFGCLQLLLQPGDLLPDL